MKEQKSKKKISTVLIDTFIQRSFSEQMRDMDEKTIAMAIKTLLKEERDIKTYH